MKEEEENFQEGSQRFRQSYEPQSLRYCFITMIRKGWTFDDLLDHLGNVSSFQAWRLFKSEENRKRLSAFQRELESFQTRYQMKTGTTLDHRYLFEEEVFTSTYGTWLITTFSLCTVKDFHHFYEYDEKWKQFGSSPIRKSLGSKRAAKSYRRLVKVSAVCRICMFVLILHFIVNFFQLD